MEEEIVLGSELHMFEVRGSANGNDIDFHHFGIRHGTHFQDLGIKHVRSGIHFRKSVQGQVNFLKNCYRETDVFKALDTPPAKMWSVKCTPPHPTTSLGKKLALHDSKRRLW